jgi:antitoxin component of RelBE/YafQ-DinJ toxin-antitoxin module
MSEKEMVSAKIAPRTKERLDNYKDEQGVSRSQAIDIILKQGLDVEESDMRLVPVKTDGGTKIENQIGETQDQLEEVEKTVDEIKRNPWELRTFSILILLGIVFATLNNIVLTVLLSGAFFGSSVKMVQYSLEAKR